VTPKELAALSKAYHDNKEAIDELVLKQLEDGRAQVSICRDFGMTANQVHQRAKRVGIHYYKTGR
jgi:hypothetical protein